MPMAWRTRIALGVGCVLVAIVLSGALGMSPPVAVVVERGPLFFSPAWIRLRVRVDQDAANRAVFVAIVSDGYTTSSYETLDGERAPVTRWREYKSVPAGVYTVRVTVDRGAERPWRASAGFLVLGRS